MLLIGCVHNVPEFVFVAFLNDETVVNAEYGLVLLCEVT